ncbi:MAG: ATP-binding protein [Candidatus Saccharibacteria bacterium]|nr:ATP-binding protein [Candidatus Saccharibacteria bacterium]
MAGWIVLAVLLVAVITTVIVVSHIFKKKREQKDYERSLKLVPMLIHLPPSTDDIQGGGRDERDVNNEAISAATVMYSIISSTIEKKTMKTRLYGQKYFSFDIVCVDGIVKYYAVVPAVLEETVKQAVVSSYPTARLEEADIENIFADGAKADTIAGGELMLKKEYIYPISTFEEMKWDAQTALLNAFSKVKENEGMAMQLLFRPADPKWVDKAGSAVTSLREGKETGGGSWLPSKMANMTVDLIKAPFEVPEEHKYDDPQKETLTVQKQDEIAAIEGKMRYPGFECLIRIVASTSSKARSEALAGGIVAAMAQFDNPQTNGFKYNVNKKSDQLATDYIFHFFPKNNNTMILNTMELASIFHLPSQNSIPTSGVERQMTKQVDGPANLVTDGVLLGINEYRGEQKQIRLSEKDRRRHTYIIGATGMGKSVLLKNIAYQDMLEGRGFAFIDPHGDVAEELMSMVPPERIDDVVYFDPGNLDVAMGMNMFEYQTEDQKDFIIQEGINMLYSLYDPGHTGIFGPRGEQMFRNAALLLMGDPKGTTFIDIPKPFTDPELVKEKLQYCRDKNVYDYWTKEFPASQKSNDAGEVITWFASKWSPFLSNTIMKNTMGQVKSSFNLREMMDQKKILLVNLSKGKLGDLNSRLLGMIFVMKFQTAAMSRVDTPEDERNDFCLFVDEFQNFATDSFESILSEARKFRLNLVVANQFMTQLTDNIREGILGNVGSIIAGRIGVTDAEMLEKVFSPTFTAEDLHKQPNHHAIATILMHDMPSAPFTMNLVPPIGKENPEVLESMKLYSATKYGRPRAEVEREIEERMTVKKAPESSSEAPEGASELKKEDWLAGLKKPATEAPKPSQEPPKKPHASEGDVFKIR